MRILVTGGAGFIGSHTVDHLIENGHSVVILDNLDPQVHGPNRAVPPWLNKEAPLLTGDIRDKRSVDRALDSVDWVLHLAARVGVGQSLYQIQEYMGVNTLGTAILLEAIAERKDQIKKVVVASSMSIYGEGPGNCEKCGFVPMPIRDLRLFAKGEWSPICPVCQGPVDPCPIDEDRILRPTTPYAIGKQDQEQLTLSVCKAYGISALALRYFNVFGSRQSLNNPYTGVGAIFSSLLLSGKTPTVFEDGMQSRDFIHVSDIALANRLALESDAQDMALNIASGHSITILEVAEILAQSIAPHIKPLINHKYRAGDIRHCFGNIEKAKKYIGFEPQKKFSDSISELIKWVKMQEAVNNEDDPILELKTRGLTT